MTPEQQRAYAQTPHGKAARQRARQRFIEKRRSLGKGADIWTPKPSATRALEQALNHWSRT